ncbi:DMT family transporter [Brevibacillus sp. SYP-B805]|uniref:EamA family transporter n=1 Tax=Brevibacillus sp. SYP-B805 TaxID=1578199 RepID=UPI0013ED4CDE|nr:DMT family transporter [Brevibacillus sp. SYP-B805]NGQ94947.1 DMT family transporter [Brevibacillus sp. SYP-B805]
MGWSILVFLGACSYGVLSTIVKFAYDAGFTVDEVAGCQLLFGTAISWLLAWGAGGVKAGRKDWPPLLAVGMCAGLTGVFYYSALQYVTASFAIILLFQFTWIGMLLEAVRTGKKPEGVKLAALGLLLVGTLFASGVTETAQRFSWWGIVLGLLAAVSYALFITASGRVALHASAWSRNAVSMTGSLLTTFLLFPPRFLVNGALGNGLWIYGLLLAVFVVISILCFTFGTPRIGATLAIILGSAELPTAVFMSRFVLREHVSLLQWAGVAVILAGIALPELAKRRERGV